MNQVEMKLNGNTLTIEEDNAITLNYVDQLGNALVVSRAFSKNAHALQNDTPIRAIKQLHLQEFYKNPWDNNVYDDRWITDEKNKGTALYAIQEFGSKILGVDLAKWGISTEFAFTQRVERLINGVLRSLRIKYTFNRFTERMNILLDAHFFNKNDRLEQVIWKETTEPDWTSKYITTIDDALNFEVNMEIKTQPWGNGSYAIPSYVPSVEDVISANLTKLERFFSLEGRAVGEPLSASKAYWDPKNPVIIELLKEAPENLSKEQMVILVREIDRRLMQFWDKAGHEFGMIDELKAKVAELEEKLKANKPPAPFGIVWS